MTMTLCLFWYKCSCLVFISERGEIMQDFFIISVTSYFIGLLLISLSIPLYLKKIGLNSSYGFRTKKTTTSIYHWIKANHYFGRLGIAGGLFILISTFILNIAPLEVVVESYIVAILMGILTPIFATFHYIERKWPQ